MTPRFSVSQVTSLGWSLTRDLAEYPSLGVPAMSVSLHKLRTHGVADGVRAIGAAGLPVAAVASTGFFPLGDEAGERAAYDDARAALDTTVALGASTLLVLPGHGGARSWEECAVRARPLLTALADEAGALGIRLALEPLSQLRMDLGFIHAFGDALDFVEAIGHPALGVVLEVNNAWIERDLYRNIRERVAAIAIVQVNDFKIGTLTASERVVLGDGDIPLQRICHALAAAGYEGWYDIELLGPAIEREGYAQVIPRAMARFRSLWT